MKKPKFSVGQLVVIRGVRSRSDYGRRVFTRRWHRRAWHYTISGAHTDEGFPERELRPLTHRERGGRDKE